VLLHTGTGGTGRKETETPVAMLKYLSIADVKVGLVPTDRSPFVVEVSEGQPVALRSIWYESKPGDPTAPIITLPEKQQIYMPSFEGFVERVRDQSNPKVGIILAKGRRRDPKDLTELVVVGALGLNDIGSGLEPALGRYKSISLGYERLPGDLPDLPPGCCRCPVAKCPSPIVYIHQRGQRVADCPIHKVPRKCGA
jgi:hypothetical protein